MTLASGLSLWRQELRGALLAVDLAFVLALLSDFLRTPSARRLRIEREAPEVVGLSETLVRVVRLAVPDGGGVGLHVELFEEFPESFAVVERTIDGAGVSPADEDPTGGVDRGVFDRAGRLELERSYRPRLRGAHALGDVRVRLRGPLGLMKRQARLRGRQVVAVEPALVDLRRTLRLAASERWQDLGVRKLRNRGGQTEFESLRDYVQGDDPRRVDWKAFARRGKPTVRLYQQERGQELILLIDCGRRMRAVSAEPGHSGWSKLDWALDSALQLAAVALARGDRVGALAFGAGVSAYVAPAKSSRQLQRLREALFHLQPQRGESDLGRALRELGVRHRRRALVLVISDVADPFSTAPQRRALATASRRHRVIFAALDDPGVRACTLEAGVSAPTRAAAYQLIEDRNSSLRSLAGLGIRVLDALPAEAAGPMLAAWLDERRTAG